MAATMLRTSNSVRPLKAVSEATREREAFRYDPFVFTQSYFSRDGALFPSSALTTAPDSVLTALAQLGAYQTRTERGFISLFDATHQYIVAEATPSIRIAPDLPSDSCPDPISLRGTAIPRNQGTCDHVLYLVQSPNSHDAAELPISLVPNLATDPRFSSRPYCQFGSAGQFYASVPIRTRRGINIGAYCVMSTTPPEIWDDQCTYRLRDISQAITAHLELKRSSQASRLHERMNRGLGSFVEGKTTLTGWRSGPNWDAFQDNVKLEGALDAKQQDLERQEQERRDEEDDPSLSVNQATAQKHGAVKSGAETPDEKHAAAPQTGFFDSSRNMSTNRVADPSLRTEDSKSIESEEAGPGHIFSKAANIIREAFEVEGCMFFDVTVGSHRRPQVSSPRGKADAAEIAGQNSSTSSSDELAAGSPNTAPDDLSDILGFSATKASSINGAKLIGDNIGDMPARFLAKLLRRYPNGKLFNFDAIGELQSSDSSEDDDPLQDPPDEVNLPTAPAGIDGGASGVSRTKQHDRWYSRIKEGALIHHAFPSARSVAFFPIWDSKRDRWSAGGFIYTLIPTRIFTIEEELSFLKAFGRLIAAEILDLELLKADKAKSDALGSLSHELRSPLHGVILGTELLNDTDLSVFQGNATHTIETCCRTLLDTVDHLLDYSKVNSFAAKYTQNSGTRLPKSRKRVRPRFDQFGKKTAYKHTRLDGLVQDVADAVFTGFNFQHMSIRQLSKQVKFADIAAHNWLDSTKAMEQLGPSFDGPAEQKPDLDTISVYLLIEPTDNWMFHAQPGAIRRIVMNLFGNSLKYTTSGTIWISLAQEAPPPGPSTAERRVTLTVKDTGQGMSEDYLRHKLFKPFSQEDELSPGTGLGLSLVKTIVSQLRGQVAVQSQVGAGTTFTITLPLEQSLQAPDVTIDMADHDKLFEAQIRELTGLRACVSGFNSQGHDGGRILVEDICRRWLHLDLVVDQEKSPDIMLWSENVLPESSDEVAQLANTPNVVVCQDALAAYKAMTKYEKAGQGGIFEFISQPIGPRILARSILLAYKRWTNLSNVLSPPLRPPGPSRAHSSYSKQLPTEVLTVPNLPPAEPAIRIQAPEVRPAEVQEEAPPEPQTEPTPTHGLVVEEAPPEPAGEAISKFLLVDDNYINLKILSAYMGKVGRAYEAVMNGQEAVDAYVRNPGHFAGILMDISMPVMDGLEATRQIRTHERRNHLGPTPVIALTGLSSDRTYQEALESGVDVLLTKPVRLKTLGEVLESLHILSPPPQADKAGV